MLMESAGSKGHADEMVRQSKEKQGHCVIFSGWIY